MPLDPSWMTDAELRQAALSREPLMKIVAQHRTWAVTTFGMECLTEGYELSAAELRRGPGPRDTWAAYLARKTWPVPLDVQTCLTAALAYHGDEAGDEERDE